MGAQVAKKARSASSALSQSLSAMDIDDEGAQPPLHHVLHAGLLQMLQLLLRRLSEAHLALHFPFNRVPIPAVWFAAWV